MVWERLRNAALIAGVSFLSVAPYTYYFSTIAFPEKLGPGAREILRYDMTAMALIVVIASVVGSLTSERYGLAGLGDRERLKRAWPFYAGAIVFSVLSYFVYGVRLAAAVPNYYPTDFGWAAAMMIKGAIFDEVVARFGMMTIVSGVARRVWIANVMQALFFTFVGLRSMSFFGVDASMNPFVIGGLAASFIVYLVLGHVYARYGIFAACVAHLGLELEKLLHAALS